MRNAYKILGGNSEGKRPFGNDKLKWILTVWIGFI
jgi:hypothetical protein